MEKVQFRTVETEEYNRNESNLDHQIYSLQQRIINTKKENKQIQENTKKLEQRIKVLNISSPRNFTYIKVINSAKKQSLKKEVSDLELEKKTKEMNKQMKELEEKRRKILDMKKAKSEKLMANSDFKSRKASENGSYIKTQRSYLEDMKQSESFFNLKLKSDIYNRERKKKEAKRLFEQEITLQNKANTLKTLESTLHREEESKLNLLNQVSYLSNLNTINTEASTQLNEKEIFSNRETYRKDLFIDGAIIEEEHYIKDTNNLSKISTEY